MGRENDGSEVKFNIKQIIPAADGTYAVFKGGDGTKWVEPVIAWGRFVAVREDGIPSEEAGPLVLCPDTLDLAPACEGDEFVGILCGKFLYEGGQRRFGSPNDNEGFPSLSEVMK